jgi:hypothetical protein
MVLVVMPTKLEARATFLDPCGSPATVRFYQTLDISDAIAFGDDTRLGKHAWRELANRPASFCHEVSVPVERFFSKQRPLPGLFLPGSQTILHGQAD